MDILVNNAATNPFFPHRTSRSPVFDKIMDVNVKACLPSQTLFSLHERKKQGSIINIASVEGQEPSMGLGYTV